VHITQCYSAYHTVLQCTCYSAYLRSQHNIHPTLYLRTLSALTQAMLGSTAPAAAPVWDLNSISTCMMCVCVCACLTFVFVCACMFVCLCLCMSVCCVPLPTTHHIWPQARVENVSSLATWAIPTVRIIVKCRQKNATHSPPQIVSTPEQLQLRA
jgi:hypothetical protein